MVVKTTKEAYKLLHYGNLALSRVEANGVRIDVDYLNSAISESSKQVKEIEERLKSAKEWSVWTERFGTKASLGSRQQLGKVLFDVLGHTYPRPVPASKRYTVDEDILMDVGTDFTKLYLKLAKLEKASGTYLKGILAHVTPDGLLHGTFSLTTTKTYRSSAYDPNLQNIPIRDPEIGRLVRTAFIPRPGHCIIEVDFKGAEVCVGACYHQDARMLRYIREGYDMHIGSAIHCFRLRQDEVTKEIRQHAKGSFTFAEFYGDWYKSIAKSLWASIERYDIKTKDGKSLYEHLRNRGIGTLGPCENKRDPLPGTFERQIQEAEHWLWKEEFTGYDQWRKDWYNEFLEKGYFHTLTGFTIHGPLSRNDVCNYPVQGSAFHCLLWCLITLMMEIERQGKQTKVFGQIHDSVVADVPENEAKWYCDTMTEIITDRLPSHWKWVITPMVAEVEAAPVGASWFDKCPIVV